MLTGNSQITNAQLPITKQGETNAQTTMIETQESVTKQIFDLEERTLVFANSIVRLSA